MRICYVSYTLREQITHHPSLLGRKLCRGYMRLSNFLAATGLTYGLVARSTGPTDSFFFLAVVFVVTDYEGKTLPTRLSLRASGSVLNSTLWSHVFPHTIPGSRLRTEGIQHKET